MLILSDKTTVVGMFGGAEGVSFICLRTQFEAAGGHAVYLSSPDTFFNSPKLLTVIRPPDGTKGSWTALRRLLAIAEDERQPIEQSEVRRLRAHLDKLAAPERKPPAQIRRRGTYNRSPHPPAPDHDMCLSGPTVPKRSSTRARERKSRAGGPSATRNPPWKPVIFLSVAGDDETLLTKGANHERTKQQARQ